MSQIVEHLEECIVLGGVDAIAYRHLNGTFMAPLSRNHSGRLEKHVD